MPLIPSRLFPGMKAFIAVYLLLIGSGLVPSATLASNDTAHDDAPLDRLTLDEKAQQRAGLQITVLQSFRYTPEFRAYGNALAIQPLLDLKNRYLTALAHYESARAKLKLTRTNIDRTQRLHRSGIASQRALQELESQWRMEKIQADTLNQQTRAVYDEALLHWGRKLTGLFLSTDSSRSMPYLAGQKTLLLISLPADQTLASGIDSIFVSPSGDRRKAYPAELISLAPQTDAVTQGESYFFATDHAAIKTGMRVAAWLPRQQAPETGVLIPASALIWHLGQAFVYLKDDEEHFSRRRIAHFVNAPEGYFIRGALTAGEKLVTTGAQMLLSEEFRGQIPDEDDDD